MCLGRPAHGPDARVSTVTGVPGSIGPTDKVVLSAPIQNHILRAASLRVQKMVSIRMQGNNVKHDFPTLKVVISNYTEKCDSTPYSEYWSTPSMISIQ